MVNKLRLTWWPFIGVALAIVGPCWSQQVRVPTDVELHATYCLVVVQLQRQDLAPTIQDTERLLLAAPQTTRHNVADTLENLRSLDRMFQSNMSRLQAYLVPRTSQLEPNALLAAHARGRADLERLNASDILTTCFKKCNASVTSTCAAACMAEDPLYRRVATCGNLDFLPF